MYRFSTTWLSRSRLKTHGFLEWMDEPLARGSLNWALPSVLQCPEKSGASGSSSPASAWGSVLSTQVTVLLQVMGFFFPWFSFGILPKRSDPGAVSSLKVAGGAWSAAAEGKQEPDSWLSRWIQSRWPRSVGGKGPYSAGGCSAWGAWSQDLSPFMVSKIVTEEGLTARGAWRPISGHWLLRK